MDGPSPNSILPSSRRHSPQDAAVRVSAGGDGTITPALLSPEIQARWKHAAESDKMIQNAIDQARANQAASARASSVR